VRPIFRSRLYAIADAAGRSMLGHRELARLLLDAGAPLLQLRIKDAATATMVELARDLRQMTAAVGAMFIVNDRADVAKLVGADGVHLGQDDLPVAAARQLLGSQAIIGLSTHNQAQVMAAQSSGADYLGFGPIFATTTKANPDAVQGTESLRQACRISRLPVVAIGGIRADTAAEVLAAGAAAVAIIGDLVGAADPAARARALMAACDNPP